MGEGAHLRRGSDEGKFHLGLKTTGLVRTGAEHLSGYCTKRKRPWGSGVFVGPTWGTVGSSIIHEALWGLVKRRVNSQKTFISPSTCSNWLRQPACLL